MPQEDRSHLIDVDSQEGNSIGTRGSLNGLQDGDRSESHHDNQTSNEEPTKYTSQFAALLITINVTVGAGLLTMPYAMQTSGLITALITQTIFLALIIATCIMCTELTVKTVANSYHRVVKAHCHPYVFQFTQVSILLIVFGVTVAFIAIIGDQSDRVFASLYGPTFCYNWYMNRHFIMSATTVFILKPLCASKTVDFLKYASFAGILSLGFIMYVVVSEFIKQGSIAKDVNYLPKNWADLGSVLPVFCLAYQCHLSYIPTAATIRKEEKYTTYYTVSAAMILSTLIYAVVSILAVFTFGSNILSDLTESYPGKTWPILTTIAVVALKCIVTLPPAFLPARLNIIDILSGQFKWFADLSEARRRISATYLTLTLALLLALFLPDILVAVDILGCLSVMFIFTLPALCYLNLINQNRLEKQQLAGIAGDLPIYTRKDKFKRAFSFFMVLFGLIMTILVLYNSIQKMFSQTASTPLCHKP